MPSSIVFTLTGVDRVGIVEDVARTFLELGGNVGASRMARLGGEFVMLMMVDLPDGKRAAVGPAFANLVTEGYCVTVTLCQPSVANAHDAWHPYSVKVSGADHEGIVHEIASGLSKLGITIESMETGTTEASISGTPLFMMDAEVLVPPTLAEADWIAQLDEAGRRTGVDIEVSSAG